MSSRGKTARNKGPASLREILQSLPQKPGVYQFYDQDQNIIYVGKSNNLKKRVNSYFDRTGESLKTRHLVQAVRSVQFVVTVSEAEALILESNLIKRYLPRYNILFKDGKSYPYLKLRENLNFPYVEKVREVVKDGSRYFGPFAQEWKVNQILKFIDRHYKLIKCAINIQKPDGKPCLDFQIGRCDGPCFQEIDRGFYHSEVDEVRGILEGHFQKVMKSLRHRMEEYSRGLQFELAARIRDQMQALEILDQEQSASSGGLESFDVIALSRVGDSYAFQHLLIRSGKIVDQFKVYAIDDEAFAAADSEEELLVEYLKHHYLFIKDPPHEICLSHCLEGMEEFTSFCQSYRQEFSRTVLITVPERGRKKRLMELARKNSYESLKVELRRRDRAGTLLLETREVLGLSRTPYRVECFDISNTSGAQAVASMVVAIHGKMEPGEYRRFRIRSKNTPDDYEMMREAVRRRYSRLLKESKDLFPDVVMVDGGLGQLHAAAEVFEELGVSIDLVSLAKREEELYVGGGEEKPIQLGKHSPVRLWFQEIRDEAHRFAITYHRNLRSKASLHSILDEVGGIGPRRKALLLKHYPDLKKIAQASPEQIRSLGIPEKVAIELIGVCKSSLLFL